MVPVAAEPFRDAAVAVRDGLILACGPAADVEVDFPELAERDLGDAVLAPGFVDAHCHLEWSLMGGRAGPRAFPDWLADFLTSRPRDRDLLGLAAEVGALACLRAGTTTVADSGPTGAGVAGLRRMGIRGAVHLEVFGDPAPADAATAADAAAARLAELDGEAAGADLVVGLAPHAPYTVGPDLWAALAAHPELAERPWTTHIAESPAERDWAGGDPAALARAYAAIGVRPARPPAGRGDEIARLAASGALRPGLVAAHCVQLAAGDAERLAAAQVAVAHCPQSNARLRCGRMPIEQLRRAGVTIGLGTDSPASGGPYDLRAEGRACQTIHAACDASPSDREIVDMLTRGGAAALGRGDEIGAIAPGMRADLVALRPGQCLGGDDPFAVIMDAAAVVSDVIVAGRELVRDGRVVRVDPDELGDRVVEARRRLCYR